MRTYSRRLNLAKTSETSFSRERGAKTGEALVKLFPREAAVEVLLPQHGREQIRVLKQCVAQESAVSEENDGVVGQKIMALQQTHNVRSLD